MRLFLTPVVFGLGASAGALNCKLFERCHEAPDCELPKKIPEACWKPEYGGPNKILSFPLPHLHATPRPSPPSYTSIPPPGFTSIPPPSYTPIPRPSASEAKGGSKPSGAASRPSDAAKATCPTDFSGEHLVPSKIEQVCHKCLPKAGPNVKICDGHSTHYAFDIPTSYAGKTCELIFSLPDFSRQGIHPPAAGKIVTTTFINGNKTDIGSFAPEAGKPHILAAHQCLPGKKFVFELSAVDGFCVDFYQGQNPVGLYVTACEGGKKEFEGVPSGKVGGASFSSPPPPASRPVAPGLASTPVQKSSAAGLLSPVLASTPTPSIASTPSVFSPVPYPSNIAPVQAQTPTAIAPAQAQTPTAIVPAQAQTPTAIVPVQAQTPTAIAPAQAHTPTAIAPAQPPPAQTAVKRDEPGNNHESSIYHKHHKSTTSSVSVEPTETTTLSTSIDPSDSTSSLEPSVWTSTSSELPASTSSSSTSSSSSISSSLSSSSSSSSSVLPTLTEVPPPTTTIYHSIDPLRGIMMIFVPTISDGIEVARREALATTTATTTLLEVGSATGEASEFPVSSAKSSGFTTSIVPWGGR